MREAKPDQALYPFFSHTKAKIRMPAVPCEENRLCAHLNYLKSSHYKPQKEKIIQKTTFKHRDAIKCHRGSSGMEKPHRHAFLLCSLLEFNTF